jgi:hypothetical protein
MVALMRLPSAEPVRMVIGDVGSDDLASALFAWLEYRGLAQAEAVIRAIPGFWRWRRWVLQSLGVFGRPLAVPATEAQCERMSVHFDARGARSGIEWVTRWSLPPWRPFSMRYRPAPGPRTDDSVSRTA